MTSVVTPLDTAREWAQLSQAVEQLEQQKQDLTVQLQAARETLNELIKTLRATVGSQQTQRLFQVSADQVVHVSHTQGVQLVTLETAEQTDGQP